MNRKTTHSYKTLECGRKIQVQPHGARKGLGLSLEKAKGLLDRYENDSGLKKSQIRVALLEIVLRMQGHFSVQDVAQKTVGSKLRLGAATIYRNLPILAQAKILDHALSGEEGQRFYEVRNQEHHDHIVCINCGEIVEFRESEIESLQDRVLKKLKFTEQRHRHVIYAECDLLKPRPSAP